MTEHLTLTGSPADGEVLARAAAILDGGGVVAAPTDTVYGLLCRTAFPEAVRRIFEAKGRPSDKALPWLVPDVEAAFSFVNAMPPRAVRLINRFWPGPLTLVLGEPDATVALRLPDHDALRAILRRAKGPVAATSANRSGAPPAVSAAEVSAAFEGVVDAIVDGGIAPRGVESTIVQVLPTGSASVIRAGQIPPGVLMDALATTVLFVCTGNSCRSPMAEVILKRDLAVQAGVPIDTLPAHGFRVASAGVFATLGPATAGAQEAARRAGLDLSGHQSRQVSRREIAEADFLFAMSEEHASRLTRLFGRDASHVQLLDPSGADVQDPFGGSTEDYVASFRHLEALIRRRLPEIQAMRPYPSNG